MAEMRGCWLRAPLPAASGRIYNLGCGQERGRRSAKPSCAGTDPSTNHPMGRTTLGPRRLSPRGSAAAHSAVAICCSRRSAGRLARPVRCCLRSGSQPSVLLDCLARGGLRAQDCAHVDRHSADVVNATALRICGIGLRWGCLRNLEDEELEQESWIKQTRDPRKGRALELRRGSPRLAVPLYTTNIATPATNMAAVVIATTIHPRRELG